MNKIIINGFLGSEPEIKTIPNGKKVCTFSLAVDDGRDANGERKSIWVTVVAWENRAEYLEKYCHKGYRLLVEGKLSVRSYQTATGDTKKVTEIVCDRIEIERGNDSAREQGNTRPNYNAPKTEQKQPKTDMWELRDLNPDDLPFGG